MGAENSPRPSSFNQESMACATRPAQLTIWEKNSVFYIYKPSVLQFTSQDKCKQFEAKTLLRRGPTRFSG